jgi:hypothetical protein
MLYSILIYAPEELVNALTPAEDDGHVAQHMQLHEELAAKGQLGPVVRLMSTDTAVHLKSVENLLIDGPFAETKEQLLGFYVVDCESREAAVEIARSMPSVNSVFEVRPVRLYFPDRTQSGSIGPEPIEPGSNEP